MVLSVVPVAAQTGEYRAYWVDTFNTTLNNHADIVTVVSNAKNSNANMILAQVRRRGDAWYLNSLEPKPDFTPIAQGFDPLADLIATAHAEGIEVHAFVIMGAVWNKNPNFAPTATLGPPTNPNHVFNLHGGYNPATQQIVPGPNNWLTRSLLPDGTGGITFQGHRFGSDFWLDFGHPDAAAYSVDVVMQLVRNYNIDGLHLDRIRYPEFSVPGQTPTSGTNVGYNQRSIERFQIRNNIPVGAPAPLPGDPAWSQWRRDQVSNVVRRIYLNAVAERPNIKISAALIAFGGGPSNWNSAEAYWRVYQDWRSWTEEGILDIAIPMNYKNDVTQQNLFDTWNTWIKDHQYNRAAMIGLGVYLNSIEGSLRQVRRSLAPSANGNSVLGVSLYSMATTNAAIANNPFSIPPGQSTPVRPFSEFASGLTTGKSVNGQILYEDPIANPVPVFAQPAAIPILPWKAAPTKGHLKGFARRADNTILDAATVTITNLDTNQVARTTATDGGGFYGGVDLAPGNYLVKAVLNNDTVYSCAAVVTAGSVTTADLSPETVAPTTMATANPLTPNGANGWFTTDVGVTLAASDNCSGVAATEYSLDGATWIPYTGGFTVSAEGATTVRYRSTDNAGNTEATKTLLVLIDKTAPTGSIAANPNRIFPPNGKMVPVTLTFSGADAVSGLASVSYVVTDEYGAILAIPTRALSGGAASWTERLEVEARREGSDRDGRVYTVTATITDIAGNASTVTTNIVVARPAQPLN
ncbi:MAG TPA: family 10 glycosylhydrolase [Pyrinomonadaceae bacterium]